MRNSARDRTIGQPTPQSRAAATRRRVSGALRALLVGALLASAGSHAQAAPAGAVKVVVLLENGVGGSRAQDYLDKLLALVAKEAGWSGIESRYLTKKSAALDYIAAEKPQLGLFSIGAFLALEQGQRLEVVGQAVAAAAGGRQYFIVGKVDDLAGCRGQALASNHLDDPRFIDQVVFHNAIHLNDFKAMAMQRPVQTLKAVTRDEARCALIDDAQKATIASIEGGAALKVVWSSAELPALPVVSLPTADKALVASFQTALPRVCQGAGKAVCADIGIQSLVAADGHAYDAIVRDYRGKDVAHP